MLNLMKLENRIVLDGAGFSDALDHSADSDNDITHETSSLPDQDEGSESSDNSHISDAAMLLADSNTDEKGTDVVLISNQAPDYQMLADSVDPDAQVIIYDAAEESVEDVIARVTEVSKSTGEKIDSMTVLSHGGKGFFFFGNEIVSASNFQDNAEAWKALDDVFSDSGKIYLFGCNVAEGSGQSLIDNLAEATGADVFASDDASGAGGDWDLEAASAGADTYKDIPVSMESLAAYDHDLELSHSVTGGISQEDRPGMIAIYLWGDVHAGSHGANDFQLTTPLGGGLINNYTIYYEEFTTDRPIIIEGKTISEYHKWTIDYQPEQHASGTINFGYTLEGISGTSQLVINPVNDPPEVEADTFYIKEDAANGAFVTVNPQGGQAGQVNAYEEQGSGENDIPFTYSIIGGDGQGLFEVDNAGRIKLRQGPLDYETKTEYKLLVEVSDSGGPLHQDEDWNSNWITIKIEDVPEPPVTPPLTNETVLEDHTLTSRVTATDPDNDALTFSVVNPPSNGNLILNSNGTYTYTPNNDYFGSDQFTYRVTDTHGEYDTGVVQIAVTPVNDAPTFNGGPNQVVDEDAGTQNVPGWATNIDQGAYNETSQILDFRVTNDNNSLFSGQPQIDANTGALTYTPAADAHGTAVVTVYLHDNGGTANGGVDISQPYQFTITIKNVDDETDIQVSDSCYVEKVAPDYVNHTGPESVDSTLTLTDTDSTTLSGATVQISGNYQNGQDVLAFSDTSKITHSWNAANGTMTLTGTATVAEYQAALRSVTFENPSDNPVQGNRTITFTVTGSGTDPATSEVTKMIFVDAIDDAPDIQTTQGEVAYGNDDGKIVIDSNIDLSDIDDDNMSGATIQITDGYYAGEDVLSFTNSGNIIGSWDAGTGTMTLTGVASKAQYEAALESVKYENVADKPTEAKRTITYTVTDNNSNGQGDGDGQCSSYVVPVEDKSSSATRVINVIPFEAPDPDLHPDIPPSAGVGDLCYGENDPEKIMADQFTLTDEDSGVMAGATMQITNNYVNGEDVLSFENTANITGAWDAASGTMTLTGEATIAEYQAAIRTIKYLNQGGETPTESVRTVTLTVTDTDGMEGTDTMTVTVDAVNDAPTLTTGQTSNLEYTDGDGIVVVDDTLTLADVDDTHMTSATIAIGDYVAGEETLHFDNTANITGVFENGVLTLTGNATKAEYQAAIRSVRYENTGDLNQQRVTKTITFNVYDNNSNGTGSRDCSFVDPSDPNYDPDRDPGGTQPGKIVKTIDVGESDPKQPVEPPPPRPDGVYPDPNNPYAKPFDDNLGTGQTFPGSGSDTGGMMEGTRSLAGPEEAGDAPLWNGCSLEEALREHLGCRFAPGIDPLSRFSAVKWGDLGWAPPRLEEEFDLYSRLFLRQAGDPGFGIELGDLAHNLGGQGSLESLFAGSGNESFNGMGPGELLKATGWDERSSAS